MHNKSLISINDYSKDECLKVLDLAEKFEKDPVQNLLSGRVISTLFLNPPPARGSALKVQ